LLVGGRAKDAKVGKSETLTERKRKYRKIHVLGEGMT